MVGLNGDIVAADETGLTTRTPQGETRLAWGDVRAETIRALAREAAGPDPVAQEGAQALFLALLAKEKPLAAEAVAALAKAETEAKAARAFSDAVQLLERGPNKQGSDALAAYAKTYGGTKHFADHEAVYKLVMALKPGTGAVAAAPKPTETPHKPATPDKPRPPKPAPAPKVSPEELALYKKAVAAYQARRYGDVKAHLDTLKARFANSPLLADAKRTPPVSTMLRAVAARGRTITLSSEAAGAARSLETALAAVEEPNATIEIEPGTHRGSGEASGRNYSGLILRRSGEGDAILDGGRRADRILNLLVDCDDVWIEGIQFANARIGLYLGPRSSATLVHCIALEGLQQGTDKAPGAKLTVRGCALSAHELSQVQARASAFAIAADGFIESSSLTGCVVTGSDISLDGVALTDCLVVGSVSLGSRTKLSHVTAVGAVTIPGATEGVLITDSIVESLQVETPKIAADEIHALAVTFDRVAVIRPSARRWAKGLVNEEKLVSPAKVQFVNRRAGDYRLANGSAYSTSASDKTPLGCRFPADMLELLKLARRYPAILKPSPRRRSG
jgi:hypothetical protein